jgi:hypothetical protein
MISNYSYMPKNIRLAAITEGLYFYMFASIINDLQKSYTNVVTSARKAIVSAKHFIDYWI